MTDAQSARPFLPKRIAVCIDGTWQRLRTETPTNIARIARSVDHEGKDGVKQIVIYTPGVGAANDLDSQPLNKLAGGMFGSGLERDILDTYTRICLNYQWGDDLFIFGFSRGAFSARSLAGLIRRCGLVRRRYVDMAGEAFRLYRQGLPPDDPVYQTFRNRWGKSLRGDKHSGGVTPDIPISYLGIFDTVGQRGLPSGLGPLTEGFNARFAFHSQSLGTSVAAARHAVAIDEARFAFPPTLWDNLEEMNGPFRLKTEPHELPYQQRWFPGGHGDIGGGGGPTPLAAFPLNWIVEGAEAMGLSFDRTPGSPLADALIDLNPLAADTVRRGWQALAPGDWPIRLRTIIPGLRRRQTVDRGAAIEHIHMATAMRLLGLEEAGKRYRPRNLTPFLPALRELGALLPLMQGLRALATKR